MTVSIFIMGIPIPKKDGLYIETVPRSTSWVGGNSLAPGRTRCHFKTAIFNLVLLMGIFTSSKDNALRWIPRDLTDDKSTLVQVMAWCRQATSHYLSQCWPSSMSSYGVTRPQRVQAISSVPLFFQLFCFVKILFIYWISPSYLTGVPAAQLWWHQWNTSDPKILRSTITKL